MPTVMIPFAIVVLLTINNQKSFVDTAPTLSALAGSPEVVPEYQQDNVVRNLEDLKNTLGKSLEMVKTHSEVYSDVNGHKEAHSDTKEQLNQNGKLVASLGQQLDEQPGPNGARVGKLRTKVDIPAKGIHKTLEEPLDPRQLLQATDNGNRRSQNYELLSANADTPDKYGSYSGIQYTPLDMAEYIFWTGDEKGVTLAIEEFLQEGLMSREEAISFLQEIKYNLDYLQKHYTEVGLSTRERAKEKENVPNGLFYDPKATQSGGNQKFKNEKKNSLAWSNFLKEQNKFDQDFISKPNEQYDELLERLRVADFLYTEYSLEEVIYQLAKVMFTQSLTRGSLEAQKSLQKFTTFLENEAEQGRISRALEKKVLDVLIAALTDTLGEHPGLTSESDQRDTTLAEITSREDLMKQLLKYNPVEQRKAMRELISPNFAANLSRNQVNPLKGDARHLSLDIDKFKQP